MVANELSLVISNPIEGQFLKRIDWNKEEFMELVASITKEYEGLAYTEDQMKSAKEDRAKLNAIRKAISDRRIEVKKMINAPYELFEAEVKEVVALIDGPIAMIDSQLAEYEKRIKDEKLEELVKHFEEVAADLGDIITFEQIFDSKWLNASVSLKKAKEAISDAVRQIDTDLRSIDVFCEEKYRTPVKSYYLKTLDIRKSLEEASRLRQLDQRMEEERLRREEEEARIRAEEEARAKAEQSVAEVEETVAEPVESVSESAETVSETAESVSKPDESVAEPPAGNEVTNTFAPEEDTRQYKASFTVYGNKAQIMMLKKFMNDNNIKFGKVEN